MLSLKDEIQGYIFGALLWLPVGFLIFPFFFIFFITSRVVHLLAKIFRPDLIPISKSDALMAFAPSNTPASYVYTCQVWRVKGIIEVEAFRNHFYQCFLSTEHDRQKYFNLYCHFVQYLGLIFKKRVKQIDLQWHIRKHRLEDGESVESLVGKWMVAHDIDESVGGFSQSEIKERPTWMIRVVPNEATNETSVLFKLHHGICDGYTIVHLADKLSGQSSPYLFKEPMPPLLKMIKCFIQFPYRCMSVWLKMYSLRKQKRRFILEPIRHEEENWLISFCTLDLETMKGIRRVTGTHFVSVLMSIQMGALRRLLKDIDPNAQILKEIPWETFIGHSMGWPKHPVPTSGGGMANHLTLNSIKASLHMEDPLERLLDVDKEFVRTKSAGLPVMVHYFMFFIMKHFPAWITRALLNAKLSAIAVETGLSTLLRSPNKHYLLGHPVENLWLPVFTPSLFPEMKLMTVPVSHSGILDISINAGASLVKSQQLLDRLAKVHFQDELEALRIRCQQLVE